MEANSMCCVIKSHTRVMVDVTKMNVMCLHHHLLNRDNVLLGRFSSDRILGRYVPRRKPCTQLSCFQQPLCFS